MTPPPPRSAFTLTELLVALAIIGVLSALSSAALFKFIDTQRSANTRVALARVSAVLEPQWSELTRKAREEPLPPSLLADPGFLAMAGDDAHAMARARVVYVKLRQRQTFPMTFDEALNPHPLPPLLPYATYLRSLGVTRSTPQSAPYESSICLLMALQRSPGGPGTRAEDLGTPASLRLQSAEAPYLADAWSRPLAFCRWPTGDPSLNPAGAASGRNDPDDPDGLLNLSGWLATPGATSFARLCHPLPGRAATAPPSSYRLTPLVISAGPDGRLSLNARTFEPQGPGTLDNLSSRHVR